MKRSFILAPLGAYRVLLSKTYRAVGISSLSSDKHIDNALTLSYVLYFHICRYSKLFSARAAGAHTFVPGDKSMQKRPFSPGQPKVVKITVSVPIYILTLHHFLLTFAVKTGLSLSVIFTFLLFSLHRLFSALLYLKQLFIWSDRYSGAVYRARLFLFL